MTKIRTITHVKKEYDYLINYQNILPVIMLPALKDDAAPEDALEEDCEPP